MNRKFQVGDRVRLNHAILQAMGERPSSWDDFDYGTITRYDGQSSSGYGSWHEGATDIAWGVRWDNYRDYGLNASNCHTADEVLLISDEPDEDEMNEVLSSIGQAARNTMSTGGSHE